MKTLNLLTFMLLCNICVLAQLPHLEKRGNAIQLIVHGKPYLMLAGEVNNSSGSNISHMEKTMKAWKENNFNSALVSVSWEIVEPLEDYFDFTSVDELIRIARENDLKLGLLWFASWKNGFSPYVPSWVLSDTKRFERVKDEKGQNTRTLSPFCTATKDADARAFSAMMKHLAQIDGKENTVIVVQIENEVGVLRQTRDFSTTANKLIASQVPEDLFKYMVKNRVRLEPELRTAWENSGSKTKGTWYEVFGQNEYTDMFFMAWQYARYINTVAEAGKREYNIPVYVNCWMSGSRPNIGKPGNFPSGGPVLSVLDIWKAGAPSIDILAPDIYGADFKDQCRNFHRSDNPLFIPETRAVEGAATWAFSVHDAICFSPFGIDTRPESMTAEYKMLGQLIPVITQNQGTGNMSGFYRDGRDTTRSYEFVLNNDVKIIINHQQTVLKQASLETGGTGSAQQQQQTPEPSSFGLYIKTGENEFMVAGNNVNVTAVSSSPKKEVWLKDAWQGIYEKGEWKQVVLLNGDEAGFLRSDNPSYSVRAYKSMPSDPAIIQFKVVVYEK
ncbi:MAG: GH35 family beta-galactosidase [Bacteroidales bacterium]